MVASFHMLVVVCAMILGCAGRPAAGSDGFALDVLTYNIRYDNAGDGEDRWEKRRDEVARLIRDHNPDVIGLQEALRGQLDDLARALPAYSEIGVGRDDGKAKGEYAAILYRKDRFKVVDSGTFWLSDTPEVPGSKSWGNTITRICTWAVLKETGGRTVRVYNVHLDHQSQESRLKSAELVLGRIRQGGTAGVILTGDFNADETNPVIARILEPSSGLVDTFRAVRTDAKEAGTFNGFGKPGPTGKIDFIFITKGARTLDAGIDRRAKDGRYPSDHFAVWAKVELPEAAGP